MDRHVRSEQVNRQLALLSANAPISRRVVHAGERIFHSVDRFDRLYVVSAGICKSVTLTSDGREQVISLHFKGDWLGLGGIASGQYDAEAIAMDTGEVWGVSYTALLAACQHAPELMTMLHEAMSRELGRRRNALLSICTLPADARVAEFLRWWADALDQLGLRSDQVRLPMSRAEIGNYLGMTLESVSRALSRLERDNLIRFASGSRRDIEIPAMAALGSFVAQSTVDRRSEGAAVAVH